jgi:CRP-like cAMP-binding protein
LNEKHIWEKANFLKDNIPLFSKLGRIFLSKFADKLENKNCVKDQILYRKGDAANFVYIIKSGEFLVTNIRKYINN